MNLAFILSMPGCPSWNGRWSGEGNVYAVVRKVSDKKGAEILAQPYYSYGWSDGWRASINVKKCEDTDARKLRAKSKGFYGYEWMVSSILLRGKILADHEIPEEPKPAPKELLPCNKSSADSEIF